MHKIPSVLSPIFYFRYSNLCFRYYSIVNNKQTSSGNNHLEINGLKFDQDDCTNVPQRVVELSSRKLHNTPHHPLCLLKQRIFSHFSSLYQALPLHAHPSSLASPPAPLFQNFDSISPVVTPAQCFDSLLVPPGHVMRRPTDTYWLNRNLLLRSHTTAHDFDLIRSGVRAALLCGDVYRRDEVDARHYPVFHQFDAFRLYNEKEVCIIRDSITEI